MRKEIIFADALSPTPPEISDIAILAVAWPLPDLPRIGFRLYINPQRLRPPRCMSQRLNATEASAMMLSTMGVVIALIYR